MPNENPIPKFSIDTLMSQAAFLVMAFITHEPRDLDFFANDIRLEPIKKLTTPR